MRKPVVMSANHHGSSPCASWSATNGIWPAVAVQERLAVGEVGVAEVERADRRVAAALRASRRGRAGRSSSFSPNCQTSRPPRLLQRGQPAVAELRPGDRRPGSPATAPKSDAGRRDDVAGVAVGAQAGHVDPGAVLLVGDEERTGTRCWSAIAWARASHAGRGVLRPPEVDLAGPGPGRRPRPGSPGRAPRSGS